MNSIDKPISEQFRIVAKGWAQKNAAAQLLSETKTAVLAQMISRHGDIPHNKAERLVKASEEWHDFIQKMVEAQEAANMAKVQMEYIRMQFNEWQSKEATARAERRL